MKVLWCWRCQMDIPMLDEAEFEQVMQVYAECRRGGIKASLPKEGASINDRIAALLAPVCAEYTRLTGFPETNVNAVLHHRLSLFGPPCATCGKPLRTPQARYCAACGEPR
ncbi:hypothetical protein HPC49_17845 [Pyxidicoccus fallax]|uniref:Zinc-ribbon domain-containing protein n=1 Tax=Pyxidicoccus fallax TaxID=394095 RepID=A0A848LCA8_9BACT|nr:hypothetical protein [Pyxidicoccus fallax]NMO16116.1 hypothetical protein [Pyxidicoccus fallax]NPC80074.1 hypothetical protein [Pyxidicoccus fallax]